MEVSHFQLILVISAICLIVAFLSTYFVMPRLIRKLKKADITGKDIHKPEKPIVAEMGGIGILFGFIISSFTAVYIVSKVSFLGYLQFPLIISILVILIVGIVGMVDDLILLSYKEKLVLLFFAGLPLIWIAPPTVGVLYLISIPIAVTITANLTNMLAGLNGIETGLGIIAMTSLTISCIVMGKADVTLMSVSLLGALIAFLYYNRYPSNVFPGDVGTLIIGANIATVAFIGRLKLVALIILMPNIIDASLKFFSAGAVERHHSKPTQVKEDGTLVSPSEGFRSLIRLVLKKPMSEKSVVKIIWAIGIFFGILGILVANWSPFGPEGFLGLLKNYFYLIIPILHL